MHGPSAQFAEQVGGFLTVYYLILAAMNGLAALYLWQTKRTYTVFQLAGIPITNAILWLALGMFFVIMSPLAGSSNPYWMPELPMSWRMAVNQSTGPVV